MPDETKICPYCGKKIKASAVICRYCKKRLDISENQKCPYCGEDIPTNVAVCPECHEQLRKPEVRLSRNLLLKISCLVLILALITGCGIAWYKYEDNTLKTVLQEINTKEFDNVYDFNGVYDILTKVSQEETTLNKYLTHTHLKRNKDKAFWNYYNTVKKAADIFTTINYDTWDITRTISGFNPILRKGARDYFGYEFERGIQILPLMEKSEWSENGQTIKSLQITKPQVPYIKLSCDGEGYFVAEVNYKYLNSKYSKYLSPSLRDYLVLKSKEEEVLKNGTYYQDGAVSVSRTVLIDWIIGWQNFRDKYPKFEPDKIDRTLHRYTSDFIASTYGTFDYADIRSLLPEARKDYEAFLKKVNSNTKEYKAVEKCYSVLKAHNFKDTNEFWGCRDEWKNKYSDEE